MVKVIYLRVSDEDLDESTQLPEILRVFKLNGSDCLILRERISAYKEEEQKNRTEFIKLKSMIEKGEVTDIYVYSLERLERSIDRFVEFSNYCRRKDVLLHSVNQPSATSIIKDDTPFGKLMRNFMANLFGFTGENESWLISQRTKKTVVRKEGKLTKSYKGNKWGSSLHYESGKPVSLKLQQQIYTSIQNSILRYEKMKYRSYFPKIIESVSNTFNVGISKAYISKIKKEVLNGSR